MRGRFLLGSAAGHVVVLWACVVAGGFPAITSVRPVPAVEIFIVGGAGAGGGRAPSVPPAAGDQRGAARPDVPAAPVEPRPVAAPTREPVDAAVPAPVPPPSPAEAAGTASIPGEFPGGAGSPASDGRGYGREDPPDAGTAAGPAGSRIGGIAGAGPPRQAMIGGEGGGRGGALVLLRERIQSRIVYPEEAIRRGLEGEVLLRIHVQWGGVPNEIRIARSSGTRILDAAARRGVVDASPLPWDPGWVEVPVRFRLR